MIEWCTVQDVSLEINMFCFSLPETVKPFDRDLKHDFLKPGFENEIKKELQKEKRLDTDLDGE